MDHKEIQFHMTTIENTEMLLQSIYKNRMVIMIIINWRNKVILILEYSSILRVKILSKLLELEYKNQ